MGRLILVVLLRALLAAARSSDSLAKAALRRSARLGALAVGTPEAACRGAAHRSRRHAREIGRCPTKGRTCGGSLPRLRTARATPSWISSQSPGGLTGAAAARVAPWTLEASLDAKALGLKEGETLRASSKRATGRWARWLDGNAG